MAGWGGEHNESCIFWRDVTIQQARVHDCAQRYPLMPLLANRLLSHPAYVFELPLTFGTRSCNCCSSLTIIYPFPHNYKYDTHVGKMPLEH